MARLIIDSETIRFADDDYRLTGQIARLVVDDDVIFIVKCIRTDLQGSETIRIKRNFCEEAGRFFWVSYPGNEPDDLAQLIGAEIEKYPHLLSIGL